MNWLSRRVLLGFFLILTLHSHGQSWKTIPNATYGITLQYQTILTDKWGKTHIFIGYRRSNSIVGKNNPMVYFQVESKKVQVFDMIDGVLDPPKYDSTEDAFFGLNRQPMLIWKLKAGKDSANLQFFTQGENRVFDNMSFHWRKENDGWYYGTATPKGWFFRFNPVTGKIENLGQAEFLNGVKNVRRTSFYSVVTPLGWAMNYRDDKNGGYYVYYQNREGNRKYTVFLGKELTPSIILKSKNGDEKIAVRVRNVEKKVEWKFFDEQGNAITDGTVRFPEDFEELPLPIQAKSTKLIKKLSLDREKGSCTYAIDGKTGTFYFSIPVDLQKMEFVFHHPKWGWVGTSGKYQDVFFLDSTVNSSSFSFRNDAVSTYAMGGTEQLIMAGYPSKIALFDGDSLNFIVSKNSFPKYFISLVEMGTVSFFLGKNDRDRIGYEVWAYDQQTKNLEQPWKTQLDSIFKICNGESLLRYGNKILLCCRAKADHRLLIFELSNQQVKFIPLPGGMEKRTGNFNYSVHSSSGLIAFWFQDSILVGDLEKTRELSKIYVGITTNEKNNSNKAVMAFVQADQLLLSGWNEKRNKSEIQLLQWKKRKIITLKNSEVQPRHFALNAKNQALFFGGSPSQNQIFELLTLPSKKK